MIERALIKKLENELGFNYPQLEEKTDNAYYFISQGNNNYVTEIMVKIDDEMTYDDWEVYSREQGTLAWIPE